MDKGLHDCHILLDCNSNSSILRLCGLSEAIRSTALWNGSWRGVVTRYGIDKSTNQEVLSAPARLAFQTEKPRQWPAWNMDWEDQKKAPRGFVQGPVTARIVESGPVRVALEIARESEGSKFVQTIRLSAGDAGNRVEFANEIDWRTKEAALKATCL
jgi:alpha-mannosidase